MKVKNKLPVFYFMPRTSATTTTRAIRYAYGFDSNNFKSEKNNKKYKWVKEIFPHPKLNGKSWGNLKPRNDACLINKNNEKVLITGHFSSQACFSYKNVMLFFILRHPIERIISHYTLRRKALKYSLEEIFKMDLQKLDKKTKANLLYNSFHGNIPWMSNFYCHALSGNSVTKETSIINNKKCNLIVENLKNNQLQFVDIDGTNITIPIVFGITESHFNTLNLFSTIMNWNIDIEKFYKKIQKSDRDYAKFNNNVKISLNKKLIDKIVKYNKFDIDLYNAATSIFKSQFEKLNIPYKENSFFCKYTKEKITV